MIVANAAGRGQIALSADRQAFEIRFSTYYPKRVETVKATRPSSNARQNSWRNSTS